MKKFFKRLSSKESGKTSSQSQHLNDHVYGGSAGARSSVDVVGTVNPTFSTFQQGTSPQQQHLNDSIELDHQQSEGTQFHRPSSGAGHEPSSGSATPGRSLSSGLNGSFTGAQQKSKSGVPASPHAARANGSGHQRAHSLSGSIYNSSDAESIAASQYAASEYALQGPSALRRHSRSHSHSNDSLSRTASGRYRSRPSSNGLPPAAPNDHIMNSYGSLPQSIYRSYDYDIMNSGGRPYEDSSSAILATAPSADWIWDELSQSQQQAPTPRHRAPHHKHSRQHSLQSLGRSPSGRSYSGRYTEPGSLGSDSKRAYHSRPPPSPASQLTRNGSYTFATTDLPSALRSPSPMQTPFSQYAPIGKTLSMESQDLDTAMRGAAQAHAAANKAGMQHANGHSGVNGSLHTATSNGHSEASQPTSPVKQVDFMYAPMSAHLATHSINDSGSLSPAGQNGARSPTSPTRTPASPTRSPASPTLAAQSPLTRLSFSQQHSPSYRRQSVDLPRHAYANGNSHSEAIPLSASATVRRASFDLPRQYHTPARAPPQLLNQRPSASWSTQGAAEAAASSPEAAVSPSRAWYRQQQQQPLYRQHSVRSSVSSLPDIDEQDSSFTSQSTEAPLESFRASPAPSQLPPALAVQIPPTLSRHQNGFSRSPSSLPDIEEQSNHSASKPASPSVADRGLHQDLQKAAVSAIHTGLQQVQAQGVQDRANGDPPPAPEAVTVTDDSPLKIPLLDAAEDSPPATAAAAATTSKGSTSSHQVTEAHQQIEQALQAAEQQVTVLRSRVSKKSSQLAEARQQLEVTRGELCDACTAQHRAPPSLPDTESSDQTDIAAAEIQLLRQALDKLQNETQAIDQELGRAREQAAFSDLERAELKAELEAVTVQLKACEASKQQLESTISKLLSDVNSYKPDVGKPALVATDSLRSRNSSQSSGTLGRSYSGSSQLMHTMSANGNHKDVMGLENEVEILKFELQEAKAKMESEVAKAREEALGIMNATGDADAEVRRLMVESQQLTTAQQEAEGHLQQSQHTIDDLQAALRTAQLAMVNHKLEQDQSQAVISQLRLQQQQQQRQHQLEQQDFLSSPEAAELTQQLAELNKKVSELGSSNAELSTDLGRALDVAQRVMEQKQGLQEQCKLHQEQLKAEGRRVHELEGFAEEAMTALEVQTQENAQLRQQVAAANQAGSPGLSASARPAE